MHSGTVALPASADITTVGTELTITWSVSGGSVCQSRHNATSLDSFAQGGEQTCLLLMAMCRKVTEKISDLQPLLAVIEVLPRRVAWMPHL